MAIRSTRVGLSGVPSGGSVVVEFGVENPGDLMLVDHAIFRALNKGALGILHVNGTANPRVFHAALGTPASHEAHGMH